MSRAANLLIVAFAVATAIALTAYALDRFALPALEDKGALAANGWKEENKKLFVLNCLRNQASKEAPVWRSWGIRFDLQSKTKPRILALSDSFSWGDGYTNANHIWWRQLQRELRSRGFDVEVIGAGYPGYSTHLELDAAKKICPAYKPDLIVWGFVSNDPDEGTVNGFTPPQLPVPRAVVRLLTRCVPNLYCRLETVAARLAAQLIAASGQHGCDYFTWELKLLEGDNFDRFKDTVSQVVRFQKEAHIPCLFVSLPNFPDGHHFARRFKPVARLFSNAGIKFVDLTPDLVSAFGSGQHGSSSGGALPDNATRPARWGVNPVNGHPNSLLTHFYAVEIADILERDYRPLLGNRSSKARIFEPCLNDTMPPFPAARLSSGTAPAYTVPYPQDEVLLYMPFRKPHMQASLEEPALLSKIRISAHHLRSAQVWIIMEDSNGYRQRSAIYALPEQSGNDLSWLLPAECVNQPVTSIALSAQFTGPDRQLQLVLEPAGPFKRTSPVPGSTQQLR